MEQHTLILLGTVLLVGLCLGGVTEWLVMRKSVEMATNQAKTENQIEMARLTERVSSATAELSQLLQKLEVAEAKSGELRRQLEESRGDCVRLQERANRLPGIEEELRTASADEGQLRHHVADLREKIGAAESTTGSQQERIKGLESEVSRLTVKRDQLLAEHEQLKTQVAELNTSIEAERRQSAEKLALLGEAKNELSATFKALANDILEEKAQRFTEQNKTNISQVLEPLKTKIHEFQAKVEEVYVQEGKDRSALAEQVRQLMGLNQQLSQDANNLALALKGSSKTQGNWGEMLLERVLEDFGLRKDLDYFMRPTYTKEDGSRVQPDAVIYLPEKRNLVLDAKVSLVAYDEYTSAGDEAARGAAVQRHVTSVRSHIDSLAASNYQSIEALKSLDFVIMFVPIEPAFILAVASDNKLWRDAWQKNVLLVSPSSLLFVVRIVANLWSQEVQKRSVQDIVRRGGELYDKLVGFVEDLKALGQRLEQAKESYENAYSKLSTGRGNLIRRAEALKEMGVKPSKTLPPEMVESAIEVSALPATDQGENESAKSGQV